MCLSILKKFNTLKNYSLQLPGSIPPPKPKKDQQENKNDSENTKPKGSLIGELDFEDENEGKAQEQKEELQPQQVVEESHQSDEEVALV